jgi:hypothetical protein
MLTEFQLPALIRETRTTDVNITSQPLELVTYV